MKTDINITGKDKIVSVALIRDRMVGKVVFGKINGSNFAAKLVAFDGENLYFETKNGKLFIDKLSDISNLTVINEVD